METPQPSDDDQMFPYDGIVQALHDVFVALGIVCPEHTVESHVPIVVQILVDAIAGHTV
jgi:hypothetical protein